MDSRFTAPALTDYRMRPTRCSRIRRGATAMACVGWALTITACQHHPLAQRPGSQWSTPRVMIDRADHDDARVRPVSKGGFYALAREWDEDGHVAPDTARPGELAQAYLDSGQLLGFRRTAPNRVIAVFGTQEVEIQLDPGVHHVWYRERAQWNDPGPTTFLLGVLGVAALVGIVVLVANNDDNNIGISFN